MRIKLYQYGSHLCSFDESVIREIMRADSSAGQEEEYRRVMEIMGNLSQKHSRKKTPEESLEIDLGVVLEDGELTADKTLALPMLLSAVKRQGAAVRLLPEISRTMTVYTNMQTAVLEIHYRSLINLKRLCEAVCDGLYENDDEVGFRADKAAKKIIAALPREQLALDNKIDLRLLRSAVRGIEAVSAQCTQKANSERLEEFISSVEPLLKRLERMEEENDDSSK
ncbi:MAG: hypothetical protein K2K57_05855 [Oscillospiraceae bacterium]|nr:hypothetical protein [Oscillospiraceae bacterium]